MTGVSAASPRVVPALRCDDELGIGVLVDPFESIPRDHDGDQREVVVGARAMDVPLSQVATYGAVPPKTTYGASARYRTSGEADTGGEEVDHRHPDDGGDVGGEEGDPDEYGQR